MIIVGCDYHPGFQQIAFVNTDTGELQERRLQHREEAEKFYGELGAQGIKVRVGMEASGHARWFEGLLAGAALRAVGRGRRGDPDQASTQAEDGSPGCAADQGRPPIMRLHELCGLASNHATRAHLSTEGMCGQTWLHDAFCQRRSCGDVRSDFSTRAKDYRT